MSEGIPCSSGCLPAQDKPRPHGLPHSHSSHLPAILFTTLNPFFCVCWRAPASSPAALSSSPAHSLLGVLRFSSTWSWSSSWCTAKQLSCCCETTEPTQGDNTAKHRIYRLPACFSSHYLWIISSSEARITPGISSEGTAPLSSILWDFCDCRNGEVTVSLQI